MNFSVFHDIFACFQLYIGESLTTINSRETTRQQNACVWYPKHARHSRKELGVMKQPCGARRTPPDGIPEPLKLDFQDFEIQQIYVDELQHFLDATMGKVTPVVDLRTGYESLQMALAAHRSIETGELVTL